MRKIEQRLAEQGIDSKRLPKLLGGAPDLRPLSDDQLWNLMTPEEVSEWKRNYDFVGKTIQSVIRKFLPTQLSKVVHGFSGIMSYRFRVESESVSEEVFRQMNSYSFIAATEDRWMVHPNGETVFLKPQYGHDGKTFEFEMTGYPVPVESLQKHQRVADALQEHILQAAGIPTNKIVLQPSSYVIRDSRTKQIAFVSARYMVPALSEEQRLKLNNLRWGSPELHPFRIGEHAFNVEIDEHEVDRNTGANLIKVQLKTSQQGSRE